MKRKRVFLGGTCNGSKWRNYLMPKLKIDYFNPVVDEWDEEAQKREIEERENDDYILYTLTPLMKGVYSIAEAIDDSNKRPDKTVICVLEEDAGQVFEEHQMKSIRQVEDMAMRNGAHVFDSLDDVAAFLNRNAK